MILNTDILFSSHIMLESVPVIITIKQQYVLVVLR